MTQQTINIGTTENDGTGDGARVAFDKVNDNFDELYAIGSVAPAATGVAATDTDALQAWITAAGVGAVLHLRPGVYVIDHALYLLEGQKLHGHGATFKRATQAATTTDTDVTSGVTTSITVASVANMRVGQTVTIQTGAASNYDTRLRTITDIAGFVVTVDSAFEITSTNQFNVYTTWHTIYAYEGCEIHGVEFDGNVANHAFGRWERTSEARSAGSRVIISGCYFHDIPGEGIVEGNSTIGYVDAAANPVSVAGTTITLTDTPLFVVGDFVMLQQSPLLEYQYHEVTDVTGDVVTVAAPGWGFAASSGTITVYKGSVGCVYTHNTFDSLNGNGVHCGGTYGTEISGNAFIRTNRDTSVGHVGGGVSLSAACPNVRIHSNHFDDVYAAVGTVKRKDHSGLIFSGNTVANAVTYAIEAFYSGTDGYGADNISIADNTFRNCPTPQIGTTGSTTDASKFMRGISITGNRFLNTLLAVQRLKSSVIRGNVFEYTVGTDTTNYLLTLAQKTENLRIDGNSFSGGRCAIRLTGASYYTIIANNSIDDGYREGIAVDSSISSDGVLIVGNVITNGSSTDAGNYSGISLASGSGIAVIGNYISIDTGYSCIRVNANGPIINGNVLTNALYNGSSRYELRVESGKTGYVILNNKTSNPVSDVSGLSPIPNEQLLFVKRAADLQSTSDQAFAQWESEQITRYMVTRITAICKTGGATVACAGGVYTAASKGGTALVAAGQSWLNLSAANKIVQATLEAVNTTDSQSATPLYFSLTTGSTAAATADIFVYGTILD